MRIKKIDGYDGYYITTDGRVLSSAPVSNQFGIFKWKRRWLKLRTQNSGYAICDIYKNKKKKTFTIHRLVAKAFIENINNGEAVNHKDGNKLNNKVDNLEWCTYSENTKDMLIRNGGSTITENGRKILSEKLKGRIFTDEARKKMSEKKMIISKEKAQEIRDIYKNGGISQCQLSKIFNVSKTTVQKSIHNNFKAFTLN